MSAYPDKALLIGVLFWSAFATAGAHSPPAPAGRGQAQAAPASGRTGGPVSSPAVGTDRRVTFRLRAPNAREVSVALGAMKLPMVKDADGIWSVTTEPLVPDIYTYSMIVDGTTIVDPANRQFQTSFGSHQAMFSVPGPAPWLPAPGIARGAIARHTYRSTVAGDERDFFVYTPPGYDPRRARPYPVLYILHGLGDDAERWMNGGSGHVILDNLIAAGRAEPMVMVSPLGYGTSLGPAGGRSAQNLIGHSRALLNEVMPAVERAYHVSRDRADRAIAGLSMGGAEALYIGLNHLDVFASVASFSGAFTLFPPVADAAAAARGSGRGRGGRGGAAVIPPALFDRTFPGLDASANDRLRLLWIVCGTADGLIGAHRQFTGWLTAKNIRFDAQEVPDVGHVWPLWRQNLADLVPRLFRPTAP